MHGIEEWSIHQQASLNEREREKERREEEEMCIDNLFSNLYVNENKILNKNTERASP